MGWFSKKKEISDYELASLIASAIDLAIINIGFEKVLDDGAFIVVSNGRNISIVWPSDSYTGEGWSMALNASQNINSFRDLVDTTRKEILDALISGEMTLEDSKSLIDQVVSTFSDRMIDLAAMEIVRNYRVFDDG